MSIGDRIAAWRELIGLDQSALAKRMQIHPSSISRWEAERSEPTHSSLLAIARGLGMTLEVFFGPIDLAALDAAPIPEGEDKGGKTAAAV